MTMTERPDALYADLRAEIAYTAVPPSQCVNACQTGTGPQRGMVFCEPGKLLCPRCSKRLDGWLRALPDLYALLPAVVEHGSVAGNPENVRAKNPDPPAPMRLEIVDLLDTRVGMRSDGTTDGRGVLGLLHRWAELVRDQRHDPRPCAGGCSHPRPSHGTDRRHRGCTVIACTCQHWEPAAVTVTAEVSTLIGNLAWCTEQDWAGDLYAELKSLHRQLRDAVGEYRTHPVGTCKAQPVGQAETAVCGGPLFMDKESRAVRCASCGSRYEADSGLRELGLKIGIIDDNGNRLEDAS
ncbi:MAG TPA: hypothetical protein VGH54_09635 [Mycobacterium sp.]|uniref:hypothetical protein n=1 Tax=Mycobacterium sp. TaxID=1785 RepID=UPI002F42AAEC